jgi:hypothetical protein
MTQDDFEFLRISHSLLSHSVMINLRTIYSSSIFLGDEYNPENSMSSAKYHRHYLLVHLAVACRQETKVL